MSFTLNSKYVFPCVNRIGETYIPVAVEKAERVHCQKYQTVLGFLCSVPFRQKIGSVSFASVATLQYSKKEKEKRRELCHALRQKKKIST